MPFCGRICTLLGQRPTENTATDGQRVMNLVNFASIVTAGLGGATAAGSELVTVTHFTSSLMENASSLL